MDGQRGSLPLRLAGVVRESIVDGPGIRMTVFTQGCPHGCVGCHNPETHDPEGGYPSTVESVLKAYDQDPLLRGVTLSGGEPMCQLDGMIALSDGILERGGDVVLYTGYTFERLLELSEEDPRYMQLVSRCFLVIDGPFVLAKRDISLLFRGSSNQRLLDGRASARLKRPVLYDPEQHTKR